MRRFRAGLAVLVFFCLTLLFSFRISLADSSEIFLDTVSVDPSPEGVEIKIHASRPFTFVTYTLENPDRLVIDPVDAYFYTALPFEAAVQSSVISGWRLLPAQTESKDGISLLDSISFELTQPSEHLLQSTDGTLLIRVRPKSAGAALGESHAGGPVLSPFTLRPPASALWPAEEGVWSLDAVLEFALNRHRPIQIAQEEVKLAQLKVREAKRALFPAATIRTSWTTGTASEVNFREISSGLQLEQPLYASGRLKDTYRQSLVNLQVAEKRQNKTRADFFEEVAQAYFQLIGAQAGVKAHQEMIEGAKALMERTQARFDQGLLTRLELLNVQTQISQSEFQRATAENDLTLARMKFLQRVKLNNPEEIQVPSRFPSAQPGEKIDVEEASQLAVNYRPDIQINKLLIQFQEYEVRIAKEKGKLRLDLSGFIGASGSAFETEPLDVGEDYFIGLKATQAWGPHGSTTSATTTKTSPRLGQTTRTESTVYSHELGLFNQLPARSEIQQAQVAYEKAKHELEQSRSTVLQEIQEAHISLTKARLQLEYARQRIAFRREQVKILEAQASLNEALPSQVLEAMMKLTDENVAEAQALTNYHVAVSKLNKAVGLPGHYQ